MRGKIKSRILSNGEIRHYLVFYYKGTIKVYSDQQGYPLDSLPKAERVLAHINYLIDHNLFDRTQWIKKDQRDYLFANAIQKWHEGRVYAPSHKHNIERYIDRFSNHFGKLDIRHIHARHIKDFVSTLTCKPKTKKNILGTLHSFLTNCYQDEMIPKIPQFPKISVPETEVKWATEKEQLEIINEIKNPMDKAFLWFQITYGTRTGETRALKRDCVDYKKNQVVIKRAFSRNILVEHTKTKRIRYLPLYDDIKKVILALPPCIDGYVFHLHGKPYPRDRMYRIWKSKAKGKGIDAHLYGGTRHSFATHALMRGNSLELIGAFMGHTNSTTTKKYAHIVWDGLKEVGRKEH